MGGFICAKKSVVDLLRQRSRPYLFSNSLAPALVGASLKAIELARAGDALRSQLRSNANKFRTGMTAAGFTLPEGEHPIIPVMLGQARIRTQISAAHTPAQIDKAIAAFTKVGKELGVI